MCPSEKAYLSTFYFLGRGSFFADFPLIFYITGYLKKIQNAPRPSEYPPVRGENVKTFRWDHWLQKSWSHTHFPNLERVSGSFFRWNGQSFLNCGIFFFLSEKSKVFLEPSIQTLKNIEKQK